MKALSSLLRKLIAAILLPLFLFYLTLWCLPADRWTFRLWEAYRYKTKSTQLIGPFYHSQYQARSEVGDLFPYTQHAVLRPVLWETDRFGFRNDESQLPNLAEVVIAGDSSAVGTGSTQKDTLPALLATKTGLKTYNLGGVDIKLAAAYFSDLQIHPRFLVFVTIERFLSELPSQIEIENSRPSSSALVTMFKTAHKLQDHILFNPFHSFKARHGIIEAAMHLFFPIADSEMAPGPFIFKNGFLQGREVAHLNEDQVAESSANKIQSYQSFFSARGIQMIVVIVPNKETTYFDQVPLDKQPRTIPKIQDRLQTLGIKYVDLFREFNLQYQTKGALSHHSDDTHWNPSGIETAARLTQQLISP